MTYKNINIMVPSYHRRKGMETIVKSALDTATDGERLRFTFCLNTKDHESRIFVKELEEKYGVEYRIDIVDEETTQPNLSHYFNLMYEKSRFSEARTLVSMIGDDMEFITIGWDSKILGMVNETDGLAIIYCNDCFIGHRQWEQDGVGCAVNLFTTRKVVEGTRLPFMCPHFHAEMIDIIWTLVGKYTGLGKYLPDVQIKHMHGSADPALRDETYMRLAPLRQMANTDTALQWKGKAYASLAAANLISAGYGEWNKL